MIFLFFSRRTRAHRHGLATSWPKTGSRHSHHSSNPFITPSLLPSRRWSRKLYFIRAMKYNRKVHNTVFFWFFFFFYSCSFAARNSFIILYYIPALYNVWLIAIIFTVHNTCFRYTLAYYIIFHQNWFMMIVLEELAYSCSRKRIG